MAQYWLYVSFNLDQFNSTLSWLLMSPSVQIPEKLNVIISSPVQAAPAAAEGAVLDLL